MYRASSAVPASPHPIPAATGELPEPPPSSLPGRHREETDPESLRRPHENPGRRNALLRTFLGAPHPAPASAPARQSQGLWRTLMNVYPALRAQSRQQAQAVHNYRKEFREIKAGDYCFRFAHHEMLGVSLNFITDAASIAASTATSFGLINWLAPGTIGALAPTVAPTPGNSPPSPVPPAAAQVQYSWNDMARTSILVGNHFFLKPMYKDLFLGGLQAYLLKGRHDPVSAMEENFKAYLEQEILPHRQDIPPDVKQAVEKVITRIAELFDRLRPDKDKPTDMSLNGLEDTLAFIGMAQYWLKSFLPSGKNGLPLLEVPGWRDRAQTQARLLATESLLEVYKDPMTRSQMRHFPLSHACRSIETGEYLIAPDMLAREVKPASELSDEDDWHQFHAVPPLPQKNTMLVGPPGSAKSYYKKVLEEWGIPFYTQTYQPALKGGVAAGDPAKWRAIHQRKYLTREGDLLGERVFKMFGTNCRNPVRILDEPDWSDREGAKRDTDPFIDKLETECLEAAYRIQESSTLVMCNEVPTTDKVRTAKEIVQDMDPAFMSRMEVVLVGGSDVKMMRQLAIEAYQALAARFCLPLRDGSPAKLDAGQQERLQSAFKSVLDTLVGHHAQKKGELRMATDVEPVFMEIVSRLLLEQCPGHPRMENAAMREYVHRYFDALPHRNAYVEPRADQDTGTPPPGTAAELHEPAPTAASKGKEKAPGHASARETPGMAPQRGHAPAQAAAAASAAGADKKSSTLERMRARLSRFKAGSGTSKPG